jgi:uncharacterized coiled-coil protein SlyX
MEARLTNLEMAYAFLKDNMQGVVLQLSYTERQLQVGQNEIDALKQGIFEVKATQDALRAKLFTIRKEA